jgi:hypothetical protein
MINLTNPELSEITNASLPVASENALIALRDQACQSSKGGFSLQSQQKFLRRVLSPDSPTRSLLMVHGTGTGKTCTAIQVAEEYILRPEFQDKKVMVVASRAVQENFRTQIFDMSRVVTTNTITSKQCTGRRYLDMLLRIESEPKNWNDPAIRARLEKTADKIIDEFYEFAGYMTFGDNINNHLIGKIDDTWIHETFDNRLLIIDEAHNIREASYSREGKSITDGLEKLVKVANGLVIVLLTATPMFNSYDEIIYYMNLFLWNERKLDFKDRLKIEDYFNKDGIIIPEKEEGFRRWVQDYVSYVKGDNPFTFPFRLPPPLPAVDDLEFGFDGKKISDRFDYLQVVASEAQGEQKEVLSSKEERTTTLPTIAVLPGKKSFNQLFTSVGQNQYAYLNKDLPFLKPEFLPNYSAKFASIIHSIENSKGVVLVYSNYHKPIGTELFAMALEESGFSPVDGNPILLGSGGSKGKYMLLSSDMTDARLNRLIQIEKSEENKDGKRVRVVIISPFASEGIDFRFIRQVHVLDPWWNMSRIEQVVGRAMRTCSHQLLPFEEQNCTVYFHVVRNGKVECFDENVYRTKIEPKAKSIANVRRLLEESAMDCPIQRQVNNLPEDWKTLEITQIRSENAERVKYALQDMLPPSFTELGAIHECKVTPSVPDPDHVRPLSSYLDSRDEILTKLGNLFVDKPIWDREDLFNAFDKISKDVVIFTIQNAIKSGFKFNDAFGRPSLLESKGDLYALAPIGVQDYTMVDRTAKPAERKAVDISKAVDTEEKEDTIQENVKVVDLNSRIPKLSDYIHNRFSKELILQYTFDHELTRIEKRDYLRANPKFRPTASVSGTDIIVLEDGTLDPPEQPIGVKLNAYNLWERELIEKFVGNLDLLFGSVKKGGKFTLSKMKKSGDAFVRNLGEGAGKRYEPIVCGTGDNSKTNLTPVARYIDKNGAGVPSAIKATEWCTYMEFLVREEHNSLWFTPEQLNVLFSEKNKKHVKEELQKRIKVAKT